MKSRTLLRLFGVVVLAGAGLILYKFSIRRDYGPCDAPPIEAGFAIWYEVEGPCKAAVEKMLTRPEGTQACSVPDPDRSSGIDEEGPWKVAEKLIVQRHHKVVLEIPFWCELSRKDRKVTVDAVHLGLLPKRAPALLPRPPEHTSSGVVLPNTDAAHHLNDAASLRNAQER